MTLTDALQSTAVDERLQAIDRVATAGVADSDVLQALATCLEASEKVVQRRAAEAFAALNERGVAVEPILLACLDSQNRRQRWGAAYALSLLGPPAAAVIPALLDALQDDDGDVRWAALDILVRMKAERALVDALVNLLRSGTAQQRKMAAYGLRDLDARSSMVEQALTAGLQDPDAGVKMAVMSSLARLAIDRVNAAERLIAFLSSGDHSVGRAAAANLGALGERSERVMHALDAARQSSDPSLQRAAERSLRLLRA